MLWIPELTETKTQGKIADLATKRLVCLKISAKGEFSMYLQECTALIHSFDLIGTKSIIQRMASINNLLIISLSSVSSEN